MLAEIGWGRVGNDRRDRHREQLRECGKRLGQCNHDRRVVRRIESGHRLGFSRGELRRALDWDERFSAAAFRRGVERTLKGVNDLLRGERRSVVERDAAAQVKCVGESVWRNGPAFRERGFDRASGVNRVRPSKTYETARPVGTSVDSAGSSERGS
jgi:hypothetical protein